MGIASASDREEDEVADNDVASTKSPKCEREGRAEGGIAQHAMKTPAQRRSASRRLALRSRV